MTLSVPTPTDPKDQSGRTMTCCVVGLWNRSDLSFQGSEENLPYQLSKDTAESSGGLPSLSRVGIVCDLRKLIAVGPSRQLR